MWTTWALVDPCPVPDPEVLLAAGDGRAVGRFAASRREGDSAEERFAACAKKHLPKERYPMVVAADQRTDMRDHIDCFVSLLSDLEDETSLARFVCSVDVKAAKRVRRSDARASSEIMWVETKNVRGKPGWVYGKARLIAQEVPGIGFLLLDRESLAKLAEARKARYPGAVHVRPDRPLEEVMQIEVATCARYAGVAVWSV